MSADLVVIVVGSGLTIVGSYFVARAGARASMHATDKTATLQAEANAVTGYKSLTSDQRTEIDRLHDSIDDLKTQMVGLKERVTTLEEQRRKDRSKIRQLVAWAIAMRDALRDARLTVPDPPGGADPDELLAPS